MASTLTALLGQFPVTLNIQRNLEVVEKVLSEARPGDLVVLPEGAVSGYQEDPAFLSRLDPVEISAGVGFLKEEARERKVHLFFGTCLLEEGNWFNVGLYASPRGELRTYRKVNLATRERGHFSAGDDLPVLDLVIAGEEVRVGIQLCRELCFPEQWRHLAERGAQIFVYMTNAIGDSKEYAVWRSHLVSRAAENQRFVLAVNNAAKAQKCPTAVVLPSGEVLVEISSADVEVVRVELDLAQVSDWYLGQARRDVVKTVYRQEMSLDSSFPAAPRSER
jgi:predicted amidohydrolase